MSNINSKVYRDWVNSQSPAQLAEDMTRENLKKKKIPNFPCKRRDENGYCHYYGVNCSEVSHDWEECLKAKRRK